MEKSFMAEAIALASRARGQTAPNPLVGAIVVNSKDEIIGRGFHPKAGEPHAEVFAINDAKTKTSDLSDCTLYVTLEPCNHFGRTPPCLDLIMSSRLKKVRVGALDTNPLMQGKSIAKLRENRVDVEVGVLKAECEALVRGFKSVLRSGRPFVTVKCATSLDGKIATQSGESQWITDEPARQRGHFERANHDTILVGIGTILADDPKLSVRLTNLPEGSLRKVVLDSRLRTPPTAKLFSTPGEVIIYCDPSFSAIRKVSLEKSGAIIVPLIGLREILQDLARRGSQDVLVEGGARVLGSFVREKLFDRIVYFLAPKILGSEGRDAFEGINISKLSDGIVLEEISTEMVGRDIVIEGVRQCSPA